MRYPGIMVVTAALIAAACAEPAVDETADVTENGPGSVDATTLPGAELESSPDVAQSRDDGSAGLDDGGSPPAAEPDEPADPRDNPAEQPGESDDEPAGGDDNVAASIPAAFHGEWNAELDACGTGRNATRLRISGSRIRFYESTGVVQAVGIESGRVVTVTAEYQGEGDTWEDERRLSLSADGSSLTVSNGGDLVRYRCP